MSAEEARDEVEGEGELLPPDWRVKAGPTQKEKKEQEATHVPFRGWCAHCMMAENAPVATSSNKRVRINREDPQM